MSSPRRRPAGSASTGYAEPMWWLIFACADPQPVVSGVSPSPTAAAERREAAELRASPAAMDAAYTKEEGVYIDVRYLGGRSYTAIRDEVLNQLGAVLEEKPLSELEGSEIRFERGTLRVVSDTIYMLDLPLPAPVRRTEALSLLGFPPATRDYILTTLEFRLTNVWGFRRLRFFRTERDGEQIDRVQAWRFVPMEQQRAGR